MCGIAGVVSLGDRPIEEIGHRLEVMSQLIRHRGPDGSGTWINARATVALAHRRLAIIDLSPSGAQPMRSHDGSVITYNGEVYNYLELREELRERWDFASTSDTETILATYSLCGDAVLSKLRGMFAFALWDERRKRLLCARDRFGIKPFYYVTVGDLLYFASEIKALLPFVEEIRTDEQALAEYLTFQYTLGERTLFTGVRQLLPGHQLVLENGQLSVERYWDVEYAIDFDHSERFFYARLRELVDDSMRLHLRSDVPVGAYLSGGLDSSLVALSSARHSVDNKAAFHGKFTEVPGYDESRFAREVSALSGAILHEIAITAHDFRDTISKVIYHLDHPVAGPGSFPQYMVSKLARERVKVVLGGQGGDETFGGYARYLLAYFEQCIRAALDGTYRNGNYVVTIESIIPNLGVLREYKPLIKEFWRDGLFEDLDARYFRLIDRSTDMVDEVDWSQLDRQRVFEQFKSIFDSRANVQKEAYFDKMTHFDFKCLLPALLHIEDRMSMAHGLESRVPFLDHPVVEFAASVPADIKFKGGRMKHLLKNAYTDLLPSSIINRRDKMGFPVPLKEWLSGPLRDFAQETFSSSGARARSYLRADKVIESVGRGGLFSRKIWGLLSLELWHQQFHDREAEWRALSRPQRAPARISTGT
jgi:asparagine synthase (glutamine-hydrolysing)